jgi:hypothetical protein
MMDVLVGCAVSTTVSPARTETLVVGAPAGACFTAQAGEHVSVKSDVQIELVPQVDASRPGLEQV